MIIHGLPPPLRPKARDSESGDYSGLPPSASVHDCRLAVMEEGFSELAELTSNSIN